MERYAGKPTLSHARKGTKVVSCTGSATINFEVLPHIWAMGGGCTPLGVKNKSPPLQQKNGYQSQIFFDLYSTLYPIFLAFFIVHFSFSNQTE